MKTGKMLEQMPRRSLSLFLSIDPSAVSNMVKWQKIKSPKLPFSAEKKIRKKIGKKFKKDFAKNLEKFWKNSEKKKF